MVRPLARKVQVVTMVDDGHQGRIRRQQFDQPFDFAGGGDRPGDEHARDAGLYEYLGFGNLGGTDADGPDFHLPARQD